MHLFHSEFLLVDAFHLLTIFVKLELNLCELYLIKQVLKFTLTDRLIHRSQKYFLTCFVLIEFYFEYPKKLNEKFTLILHRIILYILFLRNISHLRPPNLTSIILKWTFFYGQWRIAILILKYQLFVYKMRIKNTYSCQI